MMLSNLFQEWTKKDQAHMILGTTKGTRLQGSLYLYVVCTSLGKN